MDEHIPVRKYLVAIWLAIASLLATSLVFSVRRIIFHVVVAAFLAIVLSGPVDWLQRHRVKRGLAIGIVVVLVFLVVSAIGASIAAPLASQATKVARDAPKYLSAAQKGKGPIGRLAHRFHLDVELHRAVPTISTNLSKLPTKALDVGRGVASAGATTAIVLVLTVFALVEGPTTVAAIERLIPPEQRPAAVRVGRHVSQTVSSYTVGILLLAALQGFIAAGVLGSMRVPFVLPLAMWAGVIDILPIVGGLLAMIVLGFFSFIKSVVAGIVVVGVLVVYQQVKNHVLYPIVVGRAVRLNALIVLLAVLTGAELRGITGAILAIPVAAVIHVVLAEFIGPRIPWLVDQPAAHQAVPPHVPPPAPPA